jgi:hypothetical protein
VGGVAALPLDRFAPFPDLWLVRFDTVFQRCFVTVLLPSLLPFLGKRERNGNIFVTRTVYNLCQAP